MDIFNDTMERYYRYTMTAEGTWQVDICGDDQQKFIEYDRLIDAATNTISSSATLIKGHVVDMWDVGGTSAAGGADMTDDIAGLGLEAGQNQTAMIFKSKLVDQRTLKAGAAGEIEFSEIDSGSQASYFDDNYGQGVAEISLDNTDPTNPINTVRGYMLATFGTDSNWGSGIKAVNGLGTAYTYEGSGEATMSGTEPAMDISWSCSNLEGNACWEMGMMNDWETIMAACDDFWMSYDGTCEGTDYQTCLGLIPTVDSTCSFTESFPESYYMEDDSYGYPGFFKTDAVSNSAISDALTGLTALTADNLADISFTRTWDCTATAWDAESDQSTATLPSEVMGEFAVGYGLQSHNDPTEATQGEMIEDMCEGCEYTGETECFDPSCYCSDPANAANPECGYGGDAYCQTNPEACGGDEGFFDNCMMYPDSPECAGMEPPSCEETCASAPPEFYDSCMESCEGMLM